MLGLRFKRNVPYAGRFLDLYCPALRLCLEIDGEVHDEPAQAAYDQERTRWLAAHGIRVLRVRNDCVTAEHLRALLEPFVRGTPR